MTFSFENLKVYQKSLIWVEQILGLQKALKGKITHSLSDQLFRASLSIPLNIAEGNGRWHLGDKKKFFWIARGSVFECVPVIQIMNKQKHITHGEYQSLYSHRQELSKMLTGLIQSVEKLGRD